MSMQEVARSWGAKGIKVILKDGAFEEFHNPQNNPNIFFIAKENDSVWTGTKVIIEERYLHIIAYDNSKTDGEGHLIDGQRVASFPAGTWLGVRVI